MASLDKTVDNKQALLAKMTEEEWKLPAVLNELCPIQPSSTVQQKSAFRHHVPNFQHQPIERLHEMGAEIVQQELAVSEMITSSGATVSKLSAVAKSTQTAVFSESNQTDSSGIITKLDSMQGTINEINKLLQEQETAVKTEKMLKILRNQLESQINIQKGRTQSVLETDPALKHSITELVKLMKHLSSQLQPIKSSGTCPKCLDKNTAENKKIKNLESAVYQQRLDILELRGDVSFFKDKCSDLEGFNSELKKELDESRKIVRRLQSQLEHSSIAISRPADVLRQFSASIPFNRHY
jgi:chromosome segregation ATPase